MRLTTARALALLLVAAALAVAVLAWPRRSAPAPSQHPETVQSTSPLPIDADRARVNAPTAARSLTVTVVDVDGAPVSAALVALVVLERSLAVERTTGADGTESFAEVPAGDGVRLVVNGDGFLPFVEELGVRDVVRVVLHRAPRVRVTASDATTGAALGEFAATALPVQVEESPLPIEVPPGASRSVDGVVELIVPSSGRHDVLVHAPRRRPARVQVDLAADVVATVDVRLAQGITLRGRVRDHDGRPVADAPVMLQAVSGAAASTGTLADGSFAFAPTGEGTVALLVQPETKPFLHVPAIELRTAEPEPFLELQLPPGCELRGRVVPWEAGRGAEIQLVHDIGPVRRVPVDADTGTFAANDLHDGVHRVVLERTEREWKNRVASHLPPAVERVELKPLQPTTIEVEDRVPTLARVHGRVVGAAGRAHVVRAFGEERPLPPLYEGLLRANVADDGTFAIEGFLPGRWRLQAMRGDDVLVWQAVELGPAQDLEVVLRLP